MPAVNFSYTVTASLAVPAADFGYAVRIPADTCRQHLQREHFAVCESGPGAKKLDPLGNRILTGVRRGASARFSCTVSGKAIVDPAQPETDGLGLYGEPTGRTRVGGLLRVFYLHNSAVGDAVDRACHFARTLGDAFLCRYGEPSRSTAEEAMERASGTPEDLAHILLALCRLDNISARYVVGLDPLGPAVWIEVWNGWQWIPLDPRAGSLRSPVCLKIAHGRDADDTVLAAFSNGCTPGRIELSSSLAGRG